MTTYLSPAEAAIYLGVSRQMVYNLIERKRLKCKRVLDRVLIRQVDLDAYLAAPKGKGGWPTHKSQTQGE